MTTRHYLYGIALMAFAGSGSANAAGTAPLQFNWGDGLDARVSAMQSKTTAGQEARVEATYSLCATRTATGYEVSFADLAVTLGGQRAPDSEEVSVPLILAGLVPSYTITRDGKFGGLRDFEKLQSLVQEMYRQQFKGNANPERLESALAQATSREVLESYATQTWLALVGGWTGMSIEPGGTINGRSPPTKLPLLESPVTTAIEVTYPKREKCTSAAKSTGCAHLHSVSVPDAKELKAAISEAVAKQGGANPDEVFDIDRRDEIEIVTEPATLRPHSAQWSQKLTVSGGTKGHEESQRQDSLTRMTFEYGRQPACHAAKAPAR